MTLSAPQKVPLIVITLVFLIDATLSAGQPGSKAGQVRPGGAWTIDTSKSEMDDTTIVVLQLPAANQVQGSHGLVRPTLVVRCKEGELDVYIDTKMVVDSPGGSAAVRTRWDERKPEDAYWYPSSSHDSIFVQLPFTFLKEGLLRASKLRFEFTPYLSGPTVATFSVEGLRHHIPKLGEACPVATKLLEPEDTGRGEPDHTKGE